MKTCLLISFSYFMGRIARAFDSQSSNIHIFNIVKSSTMQLLSQYNFVDSVVIVYDGLDHNRARLNIADTYKANRPPTEPYLKLRFKEITRRFQSLAIEGISLPYVEADDVIASIVVQNPDTYFHCVEIDKDLLPLTCYGNYSQIKHWKQMDGSNVFKAYTANTIKEQMGVEASKVEDLLAMSGDSADGIKGIAGLGLKGAAKLLNLYGSHKNIVCDTSLDKSLSMKLNARDIGKIQLIRSEAGLKQYALGISLVRLDIGLNSGVTFCTSIREAKQALKITRRGFANIKDII